MESDTEIRNVYVQKEKKTPIRRTPTFISIKNVNDKITIGTEWMEIIAANIFDDGIQFVINMKSVKRAILYSCIPMTASYFNDLW